LIIQVHQHTGLLQSIIYTEINLFIYKYLRILNLNAINGCVKNAYVVSPINLVVTIVIEGPQWLSDLRSNF
jgi:hypothetical protein